MLETSLQQYEHKINFMLKLVDGLIRNNVNSVIISGNPGIGKTWNIIKKLEQLSEELDIRFNKFSGSITPLAFYQQLSDYSTNKDILFFDDCDDILYNSTSLNILKAASDLGRSRHVSWVTSRDTGVSKQFTFEGKIIIATNTSIKNNPHYRAIEDRMHVYNIQVTLEEKLAKIVDIAYNSEDIKDLIGVVPIDRVLEAILSRADKIDPDKLSIRTFVKILELTNLLPNDWESYMELGKYISLKEEKVSK